ncbi:hypothetical protein EI94DRAFT_1817918 [Lactarius quietus]|nr:hypothetical protein EI94DRAFT_1817918 [Lactarius quietus]
MSRPACKIVPPSRFTDNVGEVKLTSLHRPTVPTSMSVAPSITSSPLPASSPPPQTDTEDTSLVAADPSQAWSSTKHPPQTSLSLDSLDSVIIISPTTSDGPDDSPDTAPQVKKSKTSLTPVGWEDMLTSIIDMTTLTTHKMSN